MNAMGAHVSLWDLLGELLGRPRATEIRYASVTAKWKARQAARGD